MAYTPRPGMTPHSYSQPLYPHTPGPGVPYQTSRVSFSPHHQYVDPGYNQTQLHTQYTYPAEEDYIDDYEQGYQAPHVPSAGHSTPYNPAATFVEDPAYQTPGLHRSRSFTNGAYPRTPRPGYHRSHSRSRSHTNTIVVDPSMLSSSQPTYVYLDDGGRRSRSSHRSHSRRSHSHSRSYSRHPSYSSYSSGGYTMYGTASPGYSYGSPYGSKSRLDISQIPPSARSNFLVRSSKVKLVKFRAKASLRGGVTLRAAETNVPLANQTRYTFYDLKVDDRSKIKLRMMWTGYKTLTYDIPVDGHGGRVDLQTLLRRVARACRHYLEKNRIPLSWERVKIQHLEEVALGTWQPLLVTY